VAHPGVIGNDLIGPVAEKRRRKSSASLFILVQIQAGPPTFAASRPRLAGQPVAAKVARRSLKGEDGLSPTAQNAG
jgi:hypothetical protein